MDNDDRFYVRLFKENGIYSGHSVDWEQLPKEDAKIQDLKAKRELKVEKVELDKLHKSFSNSMFGFIDFLPTIAAFAPVLKTSIEQQLIQDFLDENCTSKSESEFFDDFELHMEKYDRFNKVQSARESMNMIADQVPKMLTIGVVSNLEHHMNQLFRQILAKNTHLIDSSKKVITIQEVFSSGGTEQFKEKVIEKEIEGIMRNKFADQVTWFEKQLGIPSKNAISKQFQRWDELVEIIERRNLFTHANGIVNDTYLLNTSTLKINDAARAPEVGTALRAGPQYFSNVLDIVSEFGIKLTQVVWRKLYPQESKVADKSIGDYGFDLLSRGQYELARTILEFASNEIKGKKEPRRILMDKLNLANSYKLLDKVEDCNKILDQEDWISKSDDFLICSLAISGDVDEVEKRMDRMLHDEDWRPAFYENWPAFYHVRDDAKIREKFKKIYGREMNPGDKEQTLMFHLMKDKKTPKKVTAANRLSTKGAARALSKKTSEQE